MADPTFVELVGGVVALSALGVIGRLAWAYHLATAGRRPGAACGVALLSWVLFAVTMFANGLANQQNWQ